MLRIPLIVKITTVDARKQTVSGSIELDHILQGGAKSSVTKNVSAMHLNVNSHSFLPFTRKRLMKTQGLVILQTDIFHFEEIVESSHFETKVENPEYISSFPGLPVVAVDSKFDAFQEKYGMKGSF